MDVLYLGHISPGASILSTATYSDVTDVVFFASSSETQFNISILSRIIFENDCALLQVVETAPCFIAKLSKEAE